MDVFVARQPIFDRRQQVVAYELLYRRCGEHNRAEIGNPDEATSEVFLNSFMEIGLDRVTARRRAYINLTRTFLLNHHLLPFDADNITLEVLEDIEPDPALLDALRKLRAEGYEIALDDFLYRPELAPLVELADVVKLDIRQLDEQGLIEHAQMLRGQNKRLLAEKVETHAEFANCMELGFELFQGYFFCQPLILSGRRASPSRVATLQLLKKINDPEFKFEELAEIISTDATLAYKLLRYVNSAHFNLRRKIESLEHALVMLGQKHVRFWLNLISLSRMSEKNRELMVTTLVRAKFAEQLAIHLRREEEKDKYFLAGLFSAIDALVEIPMEEVLEQIAIADDTREGLLHRSGPIGTVLTLIQAVERGRWEEADWMGLTVSQINAAYLEALSWSESVLTLL